MKCINNYIIEKLRINKNIDTPAMYNVGDKCLVLCLYNWNSPMLLANDRINCICLDVVEIVSINEDEVQYQYITSNFHVTDKVVRLPIKNESKYIHWIMETISIELILPNDESLEAIDYIMKNKEYDLIKKLGYSPSGYAEIIGKKLPVSFDKNHKVVNCPNEKLNKIKDLLS